MRYDMSSYADNGYVFDWDTTPDSAYKGKKMHSFGWYPKKNGKRVVLGYVAYTKGRGYIAYIFPEYGDVLDWKQTDKLTDAKRYIENHFNVHGKKKRTEKVFGSPFIKG